MSNLMIYPTKYVLLIWSCFIIVIWVQFWIEALRSFEVVDGQKLWRSWWYISWSVWNKQLLLSNQWYFWRWCSISQGGIHSLKLTWHLKIGHPKRKVVFQPSIFRCELLVSGRVCHHSQDGPGIAIITWKTHKEPRWYTSWRSSMEIAGHSTVSCCIRTVCIGPRWSLWWPWSFLLVLQGDIYNYIYIYIPWAPKTMKNQGFGHLNTRLFTKKTSKHVGFWELVVCIDI